MTSPSDLRGRTVRGTFFHAPTPDAVTCLHDALIAVDAAGTIDRVVAQADAGYERLRRESERSGALVQLDGIVLPGFVDLHVHAPQFPQLGKALDVPLEIWLQRYTFPLEARYADVAFAAERYRALVADLLANGTTTAVYFGTVHVAATARLADICRDFRQRAFVGKVVMDDTEACPPYYRDGSVGDGLAGTRELLDHIGAFVEPDRLVRPIITPRFTPSCSGAMLAALGALAHETGAHVQTHCAESEWHHAHALARFGRSDLAALDGFGLVGRHTILAHGTLLGAADLDVIGERGAGVAHCPYSNFYFGDRVFPLRDALAKGVRVGLGTDVSGGPSASTFESMRMALVSARVLERLRPESRIEVRTAFHLATAGGGDALDVPIGRFAPGYAFDAVRIDPDAPNGTIRLWDEADDELVLQTVVLTASRANVAGVWTNGRSAGPAM